MTSPLAFVIEDLPPIANIIESILREDGFETEVFDNGQKALDRLAVIKPDLVTVDLGLTSISGETVLDYVKENEHLGQTRVILITGNLKRIGELESKVDAVLVKPFNIHDLRELVGCLL